MLCAHRHAPLIVRRQPLLTCRRPCVCIRCIIRVSPQPDPPTNPLR
ncbi:hypothetical protein FM105_06635 [Brevibacterium yomogidense]|uniref:Uncharacterized protein n=1 Tax=Brevibacterium yomogidense TaxID=946573 RepID=A0A1X6XCP1_9MICO|nr:hypothetical protein FM105_06635 [Brevibacterium yomogidense]